MKNLSVILCCILLMGIAGSAAAQERLTVAVSTVCTMVSLENSLVNRVLLKFDLPQSLQNVTIDNAIMRFKVTPTRVGEDVPRLKLAIHPMTADWSASASWSSGWNHPGGDFDEERSSWIAVSEKRQGSIDVPIRRIVQDWTDGAQENYGLVVLSTSEKDISFELTSRYDLLTNTTAEAVIYYTKKN